MSGTIALRLWSQPDFLEGITKLTYELDKRLSHIVTSTDITSVCDTRDLLKKPSFWLLVKTRMHNELLELRRANAQ